MSARDRGGGGGSGGGSIVVVVGLRGTRHHGIVSLRQLSTSVCLICNFYATRCLD